MSESFRVHHYIKAAWGPRPETAGQVAKSIQLWLISISDIGEFSGLALRRRNSKVKAAATPGRFMEVGQMLPLLHGIGIDSFPKSENDTDVMAFMATLFDPTIKWEDRFSVVLLCGSKSELTGNGCSIAFPDLLKPQVTEAWSHQVIGSLVASFDPDEVRFEADHTTFTPDRQAVGNPRYWLCWDRGRRPLDLPLHTPTPPALSRPWLGGTLYEWPEHAALFGATPTGDQLRASAPDRLP